LGARRNTKSLSSRITKNCLRSHMPWGRGRGESLSFDNNYIIWSCKIKYNNNHSLTETVNQNNASGPDTINHVI
jgi:hypothetical protein